MAKYNVNKFADKIKKFLKNEAINISLMKDIGAEAIVLIRRNTRLGYGVSKAGEKFKLKPHEKSYKEYRKKHPQLLDQSTKPNKSNLTFTGQLLKSLDIIATKKGSVKVAPTGYRQESKMANDYLANILQKRNGGSSYRFLDISNKDEPKLIRFVRKRFGDLVKLKLGD